MNLKLTRKEYRPDGIFGELLDEHGELVAVTLEHAYGGSSGGFFAKIPSGTHTCDRGLHKLQLSEQSFETFEVTGVKDHSGLLFHVGNYDNDSHGCILVGTKVMQLGFGAQMLGGSKVAFSKLMEIQDGVNSFQLAVIG